MISRMLRNMLMTGVLLSVLVPQGEASQPLIERISAGTPQQDDTQTWVVPSIVPEKDCIASLTMSTGKLRLSEFPASWNDLPIQPAEVQLVSLGKHISTWPKEALHVFINLISLGTYDETSMLTEVRAKKALETVEATISKISSCSLVELKLKVSPEPPSEPDPTQLINDFGEEYIPNKENFRILMLPKLVTGIRDHAFEKWPKLGIVHLPESVGSLGSWAFASCPELVKVNMTKCQKLTTLPPEAFAFCPKLGNVTFPSGLQGIGRSAFESTAFFSCFGKNERTADKAFGGKLMTDPSGTVITIEETPPLSKALQVVEDAIARANQGFPDLPENIQIIDDMAFKGSRICGFIAPAPLERIGERAFTLCTNLSYIDLSECTDLTEIAPHAFESSRLTCVELPPRLQKIGESAFCNCKGLTIPGLPETLTTIEAHAFELCGKTEIVVLPLLLQTVGDQAFNQTEIKQVLWNGAKNQVAIGTLVFGKTNNLRQRELPQHFVADGEGRYVLETATDSTQDAEKKAE